MQSRRFFNKRLWVPLAAAMIITLSSSVPDRPAYSLYNKNAGTISYETMINELKEADIVLFGESHNDAIAHWLELQVEKDLRAVKKENLILGAEMFETDNQLLLDEYLTGLVAEKKFEDDARLWPNHQTDYKPLLVFAKENGNRFIATNVPRRYASVVSSGGFPALEKLSDEAKKYLPPLPIDYDPSLNCYKSMLQMGGMSPMGMGKPNENLPKAQALKDATMAHFILKNWSAGKLFLHFNGSYHSDNFESIGWYLKKANNNLKIMTITCVSQKDISVLQKENSGIADYTICIPEDMTKTY
jgi:uncharacterized iron-regulated protein